MGTHSLVSETVPIDFVSVEEHEKLRKGFQEFIYIISHDLQAPLRHAREFNKLMLKEMDADSNDDQKLYADYVQLAVNQAEAMMEGVLKYSRLNTQTDTKININLSNLIDAVLEEYTSLILETSANITKEVLPEIFGDAPMIEQLFSILIQNSLKYQKPEIAPIIKLSSIPVENGCQFSIEDNGVGMDSNTRKIAFEIFRPIRKYSSTSGIGIGLTMAKKIVESHGGDIWIDPEYTNGTRINFTIATER